MTTAEITNRMIMPMGQYQGKDKGITKRRNAYSRVGN